MEPRIYKLNDSQRQLLEGQEIEIQEMMQKIRKLGQQLTANLLAQFRSELLVPENYAFSFKDMLFKFKEKEGKNAEDTQGPD